MLYSRLDRLNRPRSPGDPDDTDLPISFTPFHRPTRLIHFEDITYPKDRGNERNLQSQAKYF